MPVTYSVLFVLQVGLVNMPYFGGHPSNIYIKNSLTHSIGITDFKRTSIKYSMWKTLPKTSSCT